jgi:Spy/CpxP family protein refolding chaperone
VSQTKTKTVAIAAAALVVTFVAGFVAGAVFDRFLVYHGRVARTPPPMVAEMMLHRLDRKLDLTDKQHAEIEAILQRHHDRIHKLMENNRNPIHQEIEAANAEIERVLTPDQRRKFQDLKMRLGEPRARHGGRFRKESTR